MVGMLVMLVVSVLDVIVASHGNCNDNVDMPRWYQIFAILVLWRASRWRHTTACTVMTPSSDLHEVVCRGTSLRFLRKL